MESQRIIHRFFLSLWLILLPFWDLGAGLALLLAFLAVVWRDRSAAKVKWLQSASFWPLWGIVAMIGIAGLWHESELETHLRVLPCMLLFWAFDRETIQKSAALGWAHPYAVFARFRRGSLFSKVPIFRRCFIEGCWKVSISTSTLGVIFSLPWSPSGREDWGGGSKDSTPPWFFSF